MITNMIEQIEHFASVSGDSFVYDCLGKKNTYSELKQHSDSIASHIDSLNLEEKSPVLVFGAQSYDMLATFVGLTKSGHAYIPVDVHSAIDRINDIIDVANPSLIIAIEDFPLENISCPIIDFAEIDKIKANKVS